MKKDKQREKRITKEEDKENETKTKKYHQPEHKSLNIINIFYKLTLEINENSERWQRQKLLLLLFSVISFAVMIRQKKLKR